MINFSVNQLVGKKIPQSVWSKWFGKIQKNLKLKNDFEVSVGLVGRAEIKKYNRIYRQKNQVTDVLSFRQKEAKEIIDQFSLNYLGEIVICYPQAVLQAQKAGWSVNQEIQALVIHGFLHLLGYDHEKSAKAAKIMEDLQAKIIASL